MLAALLTCALVADPVALRYAPEPGDRMIYRTRQRFWDPKDSLELIVVDDVTITAVQKDSSGVFVFDRATRPVSFSFDGFEQPADGTATPLVLRERRNADGSFHSADPDPVDPVGALRLGRLLRPLFPDRPVAIGETWETRVEAVAESDLPSARVEYDLLSLIEVRRRPTALVGVKIQESATRGLSGRGQMRIDLQTGWLTGMEVTVDGVRIPGGDGDPARLEITWELREARWAQR